MDEDVRSERTKMMGDAEPKLALIGDAGLGNAVAPFGPVLTVKSGVMAARPTRRPEPNQELTWAAYGLGFPAKNQREWLKLASLSMFSECWSQRFIAPSGKRRCREPKTPPRIAAEAGLRRLRGVRYARPRRRQAGWMLCIPIAAW